VSTFIADSNQYELTVENSRNERLMCSIDFSGSSNLRMASGGSMKTFLSADEHQESEVIYLQKDDPDADRELAVSFVIVDASVPSSVATSGTTDDSLSEAPPVPSMDGLSLGEGEPEPAPVSSTNDRPEPGISVAARAAVLNQNHGSGSAPAPAKFKKVEAATEVKFFGGQRMATAVKKT
jgi:hypothetical protein